MEASITPPAPGDVAVGETIVGTRIWRAFVWAAALILALFLVEGLRGQATVLWTLAGLWALANLLVARRLRRRPPQLVLDEQGFAYQSLGRPWARYRFDELDGFRRGWAPYGFCRLCFADRRGHRHSILLANYRGAHSEPEIRRALEAAYSAAVERSASGSRSSS